MKRFLFIVGRDLEDIQYVFDDNNEWLAYDGLSQTLAGKQFDGSMAIKSRQSRYYRESKRPIFGTFYKSPANLFEVNQRFF
ncbi:MAG: hypothetical protein R2784_09950 [Saprospiraceae bacterium]